MHCTMHTHNTQSTRHRSITNFQKLVPTSGMCVLCAKKGLGLLLFSAPFGKPELSSAPKGRISIGSH